MQTTLQTKVATRVSKMGSTTDYSIFKKLDGNRNLVLKGKSYEELKKDMIEVGGNTSPIHITNDGYVYDGQHRLHIAKENDLPVLYIRFDITKEEGIQRMLKENNTQTPFKQDTWVDVWAAQGNKPYQLLRAMIKFWDLEAGVKPSVVREAYAKKRRGFSKQIALGTFEIDTKAGDELMYAALEIYKNEKQNPFGGSSIVFKNYFLRGLRSVMSDESFDMECLLANIPKFRLRLFSVQDEMHDFLATIHNHRKRSGKVSYKTGKFHR